MPRGVRFTEEEARAAVAASSSFSETLRRLGLRAAGGNHATIKKYVALWDISVEHFDPHAAQRHSPARFTGARPLDEVLVEHSSYSRGTLKKRLFHDGIKERACELCGQGETWRGKRMGLILDHINGVGDDNRLENLQIVCPNCAATLDTHCGRQTRRERRCEHCERHFWPERPRQRYCSKQWGLHAPPQPGPRSRCASASRPPSWFP